MQTIVGQKGQKLRRIAVVTGTRAEYGLLTSSMGAIQRRQDLQLQLVVAGMHLLKKFGHTVDDIRRDGWRIDALIPMQRGNDSATDQAEGLARGVAGIAKFLNSAKSDIVLVLGDRIEALAGALAGVTTGRIVAHIHGGDVARGDFDDSLRHAITKLAHVHLTASLAARKRVIALGEQPARVFQVGAPGLDRLHELRAQSQRDNVHAGRALVVQHPIGRSAATERRVMEDILRAVHDLGLVCSVVHPNSDRGHSGIIEAIRANSLGAIVEDFLSLPRDDYLRLLINSDVLVGNSSSGLIEAAAAGTPAVNVGSRQKGRECDERFVVPAGESYASIRSGVVRALSRRRRAPSAARAGGAAGPKIAAVLAKIPLTEAFRRKVLRY